MPNNQPTARRAFLALVFYWDEHYEWVRGENCIRFGVIFNLQTPYQVNLLIGGFDVSDGATDLFYMDFLGSLVRVPFAVHGYGSYFTLSVMDRYYKEGQIIKSKVNIVQVSKDYLNKYCQCLMYYVDIGQLHTLGCLKAYLHLNNYQRKTSQAIQVACTIFFVYYKQLLSTSLVAKTAISDYKISLL